MRNTVPMPLTPDSRSHLMEIVKKEVLSLASLAQNEGLKGSPGKQEFTPLEYGAHEGCHEA